jgi:hypothetical protein
MESSTESLLTIGLATLGAFTGTIALVWDIYKWRSAGPKLSGDAVFGYLPDEWNNNGNSNRFVRILIKNRGDQPTTYQGLAEYCFSSKTTQFLGWAKKRLQSEAVVIYPIRQPTIGAGEVIQILIPQNGFSGDSLEELKQKYRVEIRIIFSHTNKPLKISVTDSYNPLNVQVRKRISI